MNAVLTIARASVTEHIRRKLVLFFFGMALLAGAGIIYASFDRDLSATLVGATVGLATFFSLTLLSGLATLAAIAVSMNNIGRPFSDGEAMLILSRPVARWQYALGRLLGSIVLVAGLCLVIATLLQTVNLIEDRGLGAELWGHWGTQAFNLILLASITTLMSALLGNPVVAGFASFFLYVSSGIVATLYLLVDTGRVDGAPGAVISALWYLTPKRLISPLSMNQIESSGDLVGATTAMLIPTTGARVAWASAYLLITIAATFLVAERKEL